MTLRTKVALILLGTIFGLVAVATLLRAIEDQRGFMVERTQDGIALAQTLADLIAQDPAPLDSARVGDLVDQYGRAAGVSGVRVVDRSFTIVAASRREHLGRTYRDPDVVEAVRHGVLTTEVKRSGGPLTLGVAAPIRRDGLLEGAVELRLDLRAVRAGLGPFLRQSALAAGLVAGVTTLLLLWSLTLVVVRPVTRYAQVTQEMARGEFGVDIPVRGADEIGQLGRALVRTRDSLRELSALWKDQNPLTGLPGNRAIERELRRRLETGVAFVVLYADLDNFKAFNDRYGFDRGDEVIRFAAGVLLNAVAAAGGEGDFLGHVGGDDFVLGVGTTRAEAVAAEAIRLFHERIGEFYDDADRRQGYITAKDRQGKSGQIPIAGLTIVGVLVAARLTSPLQIGEAAAELKADARRTGGSGSKFMMDRRTSEHTA